MALASNGFDKAGLRVAMLLASCVGCSDEPAAHGELGNVVFSYVCVDQSDYQCLGEQRGMPELIGVGGRFDVEADELFSSRENLESASPNVVENGFDAFTWRREGYGAILVFESFGEIEDFVHLKGANVATLRVQDESGTVALDVSLLTATRSSVFVIPYARNGATLGGGFDYVWTSEDEGVVHVSSNDRSNQVILEGVARGTTTVSVTLAGVATTIVVNVNSNPDLPTAEQDGGDTPSPRDGAPLGDGGDRGGDATAPTATFVEDAGAPGDAGHTGDAGRLDSGHGDATTPPAPDDASRPFSDGASSADGGLP